MCDTACPVGLLNLELQEFTDDGLWSYTGSCVATVTDDGRIWADWPNGDGGFVDASHRVVWRGRVIVYGKDGWVVSDVHVG